MRFKKRFIALLASLSLLASCGSELPTTTAIDTTTASTTTSAATTAEVATTTTATIDTTNPIVCITLEDNRTITLELYPDIAPITVNNFLTLVDQQFYDGLIFHRVIENFMIQTGGTYIIEQEDEEGNIKKYLYEKNSGNTIFGEFSDNGYQNDLSHTAGVLSMARATAPDSASSQFFICSVDYPYLDGKYAAFGKCVDQASLDVVVAISKVETIAISYSYQNLPIEPITIKTIRRVNNG